MEISELAELLRAVASILWVVVAAVVVFALRKVIAERGPLSKLGLGPAGVTMEFTEQKLKEAADRQLGVATTEPLEAQRPVGETAPRLVAKRLARSSDLVARAAILWVDDHPENNAPVVDLLRHYGASVDLVRTNLDALGLLEQVRYDVIVSDVARDDEGPNSQLKGLELAQLTKERTSQKVILFTGRFDPLTYPEATLEERLQMAAEVSRSVFGIAVRFDSVLHLILDVLERDS